MTSSAAWQLAFGLIAVLIIFALVTGTRRTIAIGTLLILIPFQFVDTKYASSSVLIAYALAGVLIAEGALKVRMLPAIALVALAYLISLAQADREQLSMNLIAVFQFFSCFFVFLLSYNFAKLVRRERTVSDVLIVMNCAIVIYCALQLIAGPGESFSPFGIQAFEFNSNRDPDDPRLIGPFGNPGTTAGYFTLMVLVCAVDLVFARGLRTLMIMMLAGLNVLGLVATGNRTGFLVLLALFPVFLFVFRRELGSVRVTQFVIGGMVVVILASVIAVAFTDFGRLFTRLGNVTETEAGVPTTRSETWPIAMEKIRKNPWLGEGPYFMTAEDAEMLGEIRAEFEELGDLETRFDPYPHSLYLYLLRTVGIVGLAAVLWFFLRAWHVLLRALRRDAMNAYAQAIVKLGLLFIPAFLVAQITLEFNRPTTMDYAQFVFALVGLLIGTSERNGETRAASAGPPAVVLGNNA